MHTLVYTITALLVFFPAIGFLFLKSSSKETHCERAVRLTLVLLFLLQIATFLCLAAVLLTGGWHNGDLVSLFSIMGLYAIDLAAFMSIFFLPESCQTDRSVERLLHIYIILYIFLFIAGVFLAPIINALLRF